MLKWIESQVKLFLFNKPASYPTHQALILLSIIISVVTKTAFLEMLQILVYQEVLLNMQDMSGYITSTESESETNRLAWHEPKKDLDFPSPETHQFVCLVG